MTLQEIKPNMVINTRTKEEFERICRLLDSEGFRDAEGDYYLDWINKCDWKIFTEKFCFDIYEGISQNISYFKDLENKDIIDSTLIPSKTETIIERTKSQFTKVEDYEFLAYEVLADKYRFEVNKEKNALHDWIGDVKNNEIKLYTFEKESTMNKWINKEID